LIINCAYGTSVEVFKVTEALLKKGKTNPYAIFANNDMAAVGTMLACRSMGMKVPEDIGIVGFSNWQFYSIIEPGLTSISQPGFKIGEIATQMLLDIIKKT
jgi:LacI family transcriptional regulator